MGLSPIIRNLLFRNGPERSSLRAAHPKGLGLPVEDRSRE
jgi:hypothetical protein